MNLESHYSKETFHRRTCLKYF